MQNFVILIGGPGLFEGCDKAHDQNWSNYIVPLQLAAQRDTYKKLSTETIHWLVYEPPYEARWKDDSTIDATEKKEDDGYNLHSIRKTAADRIISNGAISYLDRIKQIANSNNIHYKGLKNPQDFWSHLATFADNSISRVWYSGHAGENELMLALTHNSSCHAAVFNKDLIQISDIPANKILKIKFSSSSLKIFKFYGCYTVNFAKEWNTIFDVGSAGAKNKIDFGVINRPSSIANIMERIENTPTSLGSPEWKVFP